MRNDHPNTVFTISVNFRNTEIYVEQNNQIIWRVTLQMGGIDLIFALMNYLRLDHDLQVGRMTAEIIVLTLGLDTPSKDHRTTIRGRNLKTNLPGQVEITDIQVSKGLEFQLGDFTYRISAIFRNQGNDVPEENYGLDRVPAYLERFLLDSLVILTGEFGKLVGLATSLENALKTAVTMDENSK